MLERGQSRALEDEDIENREKISVNRGEEDGLKKVASCANLLSSERAALSESGLTTGWLAENGRAAGTDDDSLCV